jgi:hypothetical protein
MIDILALPDFPETEAKILIVLQKILEPRLVIERDLALRPEYPAPASSSRC